MSSSKDPAYCRWWRLGFALVVLLLAPCQGFAQDGSGFDPEQVRLRLLLSLLQNELEANEVARERLAKERADLRARRAELRANRTPDQNSDQLDQVVRRLAEVDQEITTLEVELPEVQAELADLQSRLQGEEMAPTPAGAGAANADAADGQADEPNDPGAELWPSERQRVQEALVYFGGYDAQIDGDFGPRTEAAIRSYQARIEASQTGSLTPDQQARLLKDAAAFRQKHDLRVLANNALGFQTVYPAALLTQQSASGERTLRLATADGRAELLITAMAEGTTVETLYEEVLASFSAAYGRIGPDWYVAAGILDERSLFYDVVRRAGPRILRSRFVYPAEERDIWAPFTVIVYNAFRPMPMDSS